MADPKTHLPMDRRLLGRTGFVKPDERDQYIASLPDVGDKGEWVDVPGQAATAVDDPAPAAEALAPAPGPLGGLPSDDAGNGGAGPDGSGFGQVG